jgi:vancomycin permeability regulator SanA
MKLYNLPLFKHVYYWHVLPKENMSPSVQHKENLQLFRDALSILNFVLGLTLISAFVFNWVMYFLYSPKTLYISLVVDAFILSVILLKRKRLRNMIIDYYHDRIKTACF